MFAGRLIFKQVMDLMPLPVFRRCVEKYKGDFNVKTFSCLDQFLCMAFAQVTHRESLLDIEICLRSQNKKLYHMGIRGRVSRSTLAEANEKRNWRIYAEFAQSLIGTASSDNKMIPVIDRYDIEESHREVYINCDLCRAKRVAQDVVSINSPYLCPYFGIESNKQTRCCIPMVMGGRVGAVFTFVVAKNLWMKKQSEIPIIKKYLEETAPILSSLRLLQISKDQALRDPLTQCHNRRFMDEYLIQLEYQQARKPQNIGFIMADLDHFKMVNDEFGHLAGDEVLKQLSVLLKQNIRKSDLLIRYGGEEFLIILLDIKDSSAILTIAEKIRKGVEDTKFLLPAGGVIRKTLSIGTAEYPKDADHFYQAMKYADVALYQAKERGRNKVIQFLKEMWVDEGY